MQTPFENPKAILKKTMAEFRSDERILRGQFLDEINFAVVCAMSKKCVVADFREESKGNRVVMVGFDVIGDIFMI